MLTKGPLELFEVGRVGVGIAEANQQRGHFFVRGELGHELDDSFGGSHLLDRSPTRVQLVGCDAGHVLGGKMVAFQGTLREGFIGTAQGLAESPPGKQRHHDQQQHRPHCPQHHHRPLRPMNRARMQRVEDRLNVGIALVRIDGQAAVDDFGQRPIHARHLPVLVRGRRVADQSAIEAQTLLERAPLFEPFNGLVAPVRRMAGQHAVQQRPQRVDIPPRVRHSLEIGLLGCHVEQRAQGGPLLVRQTRLAKIGQPWLVVLIQQHVGRLQIAMQHAFAVGMQQPDRHLLKHLDSLGHGHGALLKTFGQRTLLQVLHDVVRRIGIPSHADQLNHVTVGKQEGELFDLARQQRPVEAAAMGIELDGNPSAGVALNGYPDFAECPNPQELLQFIAWHLGGRVAPLKAHFLRPELVVVILRDSRVAAAHGEQYNRRRAEWVR